MPVMPDEIQLDHCYRLAAINGRRIVAKVTGFGSLQIRIAENSMGPSDDDAILERRLVRFVWRSARAGAQWTTAQQQQELGTFALWAEQEVEGA